jgi:hypothetical protein
MKQPFQNPTVFHLLEPLRRVTAGLAPGRYSRLEKLDVSFFQELG